MYDTGVRAQSRRADGASNDERVVDEGWAAAGGKSGGVREWCGARWDGEGRGGEKREVGEQYLGDFALYLEMSFVGSISSTIRTLSLCPGVYRGVGSIRVYLCLQIDTRRTWVHPFLPYPPLRVSPFSLHFSLLSHASPVSPVSPPIYVSRHRATQLCTNRIVATSISRWVELNLAADTRRVVLSRTNSPSSGNHVNMDTRSFCN